MTERRLAVNGWRRFAPWVAYSVALVLLAPARPMDAGQVAAVCFAVLAPAIAVGLSRSGFDTGTIAIIVVAIALDLVYLARTGVGERNYDGLEQLKYVGFIAHDHALPSPEACFVCHHPPLYYLAAAGVQLLVERTRFAPVEAGLQGFSVVLFTVFLIYSAQLARRVGGSIATTRLAVALVGLWPYSFYYSVRVHNDALIAPLMIAALYHTVRWYDDDHARDLYVGAAACALGLVTKSSGIIAVAILGVAVAARCLRAPRSRRRLAHATAAALIVAAGMGLNLAWKAPMKAAAGKSTACTLILGTACRIGSHEFVGNRLRNYVYLDLMAYAHEPYVLARRGDNRDYFWNDLLKSSLFGTSNQAADPTLAYELNRHLATWMGWLLLAMVLYGLAALGATEWRRAWILVAKIAAALAFLIGFRVLIPAAHHNDFRHVFSILPAAAVLFALGTARLARRRPALGRLGVMLAVSFLVLSVAYHVPKYRWATALLRRTIHLDLAARSTIVAEGTPWDDPRNLILEGGHTLELAATARPTVRWVDTSLDVNDRYEITLRGTRENRRLLLGPSSSPPTGLARYRVVVEPPVEGVDAVLVRAVSGDHAYALGHLVIE